MKNFSQRLLRSLPLLLLLSGLSSCKKEESTAEGTPSVGLSVADRTNTDKTKVFQRAFWRQPGEDDRILHAERREWIEGTDVSRWQWFLVLEPSEELVEELRVKNRFNLQEESSGQKKWQEAPEWFRPKLAASTILSSGDGEMTLIFQEKQLFATGAGGGFSQGSELPLPASGQSVEEPPGRLPNYSPPTVKGVSD